MTLPSLRRRRRPQTGPARAELNDATPGCGADIWLLGTSTGPASLDEDRSYRTHCQQPPGHESPCQVRLAGEVPTGHVVPVTVTWPTVPTDAALAGDRPGGVRPLDRILQLCRNLGAVAVTTTEDCMTGCGIRDVTHDTDWCIYDVDEDDGPLASGLQPDVAQAIAVVLNTYAGLYDLAMIDQPGPVTALLADIAELPPELDQHHEPGW